MSPKIVPVDQDDEASTQNDGDCNPCQRDQGAAVIAAHQTHCQGWRAHADPNGTSVRFAIDAFFRRYAAGMIRRVVWAQLALLLLLAGCSRSVKPNVAVHMVSGSIASECTQMARYNVESARKQYAAHRLNPKYGVHDLKVALAVIKTAADQLPVDDPVRVGAIKYVQHGTSYPYFRPCRRIFNLADTGAIPVPR